MGDLVAVACSLAPSKVYISRQRRVMCVFSDIRPLQPSRKEQCRDYSHVVVQGKGCRENGSLAPHRVIWLGGVHVTGTLLTMALYSLHRVARENQIKMVYGLFVSCHESFAFSKIWNIQERNEIPITLDK